jgi:hypothetical protein
MSDLIQTLRRKLAGHLATVQQSPLYLDFVAEDTSPKYTQELLKQAMLEIFWYAPLLIEAVFLAIGRMPKNHPALMKQVTQIALVEANHFVMAYRDYLKLGGDGEWPRTARISAGAFLLGSLCKRLAEHEDPFSLLGVIYLIEGIAPELNQKVKEAIARKLTRPAPALSSSEFVDSHAEENEAHTRYMEKVIGQVVATCPSSSSAIEYGFDCFSLVYPLPIWHGAWLRSQPAR